MLPLLKYFNAVQLLFILPNYVRKSPNPALQRGDWLGSSVGISQLSSIAALPLLLHCHLAAILY